VLAAALGAGLRVLMPGRRELVEALPLDEGAGVLAEPCEVARLLRGLPFLFVVTAGLGAGLRLRLRAAVVGVAAGATGVSVVVSAES
jgi:hypothetical protein